MTRFAHKSSAMSLLIVAGAAAQEVGTISVNSARHNAILREKMAALANQNPELLAALEKRLELKKKLERERAKKFD